MIGWIERFAQHKIAANGAMILIALSGIWGIGQVNNQFFPDFDFDVVRVEASWSGVSAEDMYDAVAVPMQQALVGMPEIDSLTANARDGRVSLWVRVSDRAESSEALADLIDEQLAGVSLPADVDDIDINIPQRRESVADLLIYGDVPRDELADIAFDMQSQLLSAGLAQVDLSGVPNQQVEITVPMERLLDTGLTLSKIAQAVADEYTPQPGGTTSSNPVTLQLRSRTSVLDLDSLYNTIILTWNDGSVLRLGDIADISRVSATNAEEINFEGKPAIRLQLRRTVGEDTLTNAEIMNTWLDEFRPTLPETVAIHAYNETWQIVSDQLNMLIKNGVLGMVLVLIALFFFLNARLAFWVAVGIPTSFLATFLMMSFTDTTLNTISLFAFMIALGIIVDDAIVVGEQARSYQQLGMDPKSASIKAAKKMWPPVLASSLTTIAAFVPLLYISGSIGRLSADIPVIVTVAILASLIECFLILPGHLSHSHHKEDRPLRKKLDAAFNNFRDNRFRPLVRWTLRNRIILIAILIANLFIAINMISTRTVPYQFQPAVESPSLSVTVEFAEGVEQSKVDGFIDHLTEQLQFVEDETGYDFIKTAIVTRNNNDRPNRARIDVELISDQNRPFTNQELVTQWRQATVLPSEIDSISFGRGRRWGGESGDVNIRLSGDNIAEIKAAALDLQARLETVPALQDPTDDLPLGDEQLQFELTPLARDMGISEATIASFMRQALEGVSATDQVRGLQTIDVTVALPLDQRAELTDLLSLPFQMANGDLIPLDDLIVSNYRRGIDAITAQEGQLSATVSATLNDNMMTSDEMYSLLENEVLPSFQATHGTIDVQLTGDAEDQEQFFSETLLIMVAVFGIIYGILAWVFESWVWPLAILITVPFGLIGAIYGHWIIDLPLSSLSILGLFGLAGIVINDSIVLVSVYRDLRDEGWELIPALEEAVARRLRPVILTSVTTMAGLTPILFETSLDAQFLKPIAAGLVFGLLVGTVLILLFVPSILLTLEQITQHLKNLTKKVTLNPRKA